MILGVDPTCSAARPSACALLDGRASLVRLQRLRSDAALLSFALEHKRELVAIDSPLGFPLGMCCLEADCDCRSVHDFKGRVCERALIARGIGLYVTTKRSFIKPMIYRAIELAQAFEDHGIPVIEVYPFAAKVILFGRPVPPKSSRAGLEFLRQRLGRLVGGVRSYEGRLDHDLCDALVAAYTGWLHLQGKTESLGLEAEAQIVVPRLG